MKKNKEIKQQFEYMIQDIKNFVATNELTKTTQKQNSNVKEISFFNSAAGIEFSFTAQGSEEHLVKMKINFSTNSKKAVLEITDEEIITDVYNILDLKNKENIKEQNAQELTKQIKTFRAYLMQQKTK